MLRVTFSIIMPESLRRIARWVVFAVISFFGKLAARAGVHTSISDKVDFVG